MADQKLDVDTEEQVTETPAVNQEDTETVAPVEDAESTETETQEDDVVEEEVIDGPDFDVPLSASEEEGGFGPDGRFKDVDSVVAAYKESGREAVRLKEEAARLQEWHDKTNAILAGNPELEAQFREAAKKLGSADSSPAQSPATSEQKLSPEIEALLKKDVEQKKTSFYKKYPEVAKDKNSHARVARVARIIALENGEKSKYAHYDHLEEAYSIVNPSAATRKAKMQGIAEAQGVINAGVNGGSSVSKPSEQVVSLTKEQLKVAEAGVANGTFKSIQEYADNLN